MRILLLAILALGLTGTASAADRPANVVLFFADDLGYGDLGCYGAKTIRTPNIDGIASAGIRFTDFYVAQAVCSASRAALMTGCYPQRVGILGALGPNAAQCLAPEQFNLARLAKSKGLAAGIFGKWHLGCKQNMLPTHRGFDEYFGLPYSNDMSKWHPTVKTHPPLPLYDGDKAVEMDPPMDTLTRRTADRAVDFVRKHKSEPFFLYVPFSMPHVPLGASPDFRGKSKAGMYGDVIEELDHSVGRVLATISECGLDNNTLVIFTSDNGPWLAYGNHGGSAGPLREGKGTAWDGGVRVPCVARWLGHIPPGAVSHEPLMTIDILPTLARVWEQKLPADTKLDGRDAWDMFTGKPGATSPHEALYFFYGTPLHAVRAGRWKLHVPHPYVHIETPGKDGMPGKVVTLKVEKPLLYDLSADIAESQDVADRHPEVVARLTALAERAKAEIRLPAKKE